MESVMAGIEVTPHALPSVTCPLTGNPAPAAFTVTVNAPLACVSESSITDTEKVAVPVVVGVPETTPLEKLSPTPERLCAPAVSVQIYPEPDPPVTARLWE